MVNTAKLNDWAAQTIMPRLINAGSTLSYEVAVKLMCGLVWGHIGERRTMSRKKWGFWVPCCETKFS